MKLNKKNEKCLEDISKLGMSPTVKMTRICNFRKLIN